MDIVVLKLAFSLLIIFIFLYLVMRLLNTVWANKAVFLLFLFCLGCEVVISWSYGWIVLFLSSLVLSLGAYAFILSVSFFDHSICLQLLRFFSSPQGRTSDEFLNFSKSLNVKD